MFDAIKEPPRFRWTHKEEDWYGRRCYYARYRISPDLYTTGDDDVAQKPGLKFLTEHVNEWDEYDVLELFFVHGDADHEITPGRGPYG